MNGSGSSDSAVVRSCWNASIGHTKNHLENISGHWTTFIVMRRSGKLAVVTHTRHGQLLMPYHVIFSLPEAAIWEGPGTDSETTYATFEEAKAAAIEDLEHWLGEIQSNLEELKAAKSIRDLSYHN